MQEVQEVPGEGEQLTGVSDNTYNLSSVLYHAAQGGTQYAKYIEDAEGEGDGELAEFFREVQAGRREGPEGQGPSQQSGPPKA